MFRKTPVDKVSKTEAKRLRDRVEKLEDENGRQKRRIRELEDQAAINARSLQMVIESEEMLRAKVSSYTALFERDRLDCQAGLNTKPER